MGSYFSGQLGRPQRLASETCRTERVESTNDYIGVVGRYRLFGRVLTRASSPGIRNERSVPFGAAIFITISNCAACHFPSYSSTATVHAAVYAGWFSVAVAMPFIPSGFSLQRVRPRGGSSIFWLYGPSMRRYDLVWPTWYQPVFTTIHQSYALGSAKLTFDFRPYHGTYVRMEGDLDNVGRRDRRMSTCARGNVDCVDHSSSPTPQTGSGTTWGSQSAFQPQHPLLDHRHI